jgi:hypothetical protein
MYAIWGFLKFDVERVVTKFIYVDHLVEKTYTFKRSHLNKLIKTVLKKILTVERYYDDPKEDFEMKKEGPLCDWCEFRKRGICKENHQDFLKKVMKYAGNV